MPKIIEITPFNFEVLALEIKLQTHWKYVDKFIVFEANTNYRGNKKKFHSEDYLEFFDKYSEKLDLVKIEIPESEFSIFSPTSQGYETLIKKRFEKYFLHKNLGELELKEDDLIIMSDCDEVLEPKFLQSIAAGEIKVDSEIIVSLKNYSNKLNLYSPSNRKVFHKNSKLRPQKSPDNHYSYKFHVLPISTLNNFKKLGYIKCSKQVRDKLMTVFSNDSDNVSHYGWHFQNLMSAEDYVNKKFNYMVSYSGEMYDEEDTRAKNLKEAEFRIANRIPLSEEVFNIKGELDCLELDSLENLPPYVKNNIKKFKEWLWV